MAKVFFSYSHRDEDLRNQLEEHLALVKREGLIDTWHDRRIEAGEHIDGKISEHLESSQVVLLIVSSSFLASDYCFDVEMKRALELHASGKLRVIPVIAHPCDWKSAPFGRLRATPPDGKPLSKHPNVHDGLLAVALDVRRAIEQLEPAPHVPQQSPATPALLATPGPRSSNLRIKRTFSDRDRDRFLESTFDYIANFFESSLQELEARNRELETTFRRIDANRFTAALFVGGTKRSSCRIWRGGSLVGDIAFAAGDSGPDNTYNEALTVVGDGFSLALNPLGIRFSHSERRPLTQEGAAEYFWSILVAPLQ